MDRNWKEHERLQRHDFAAVALLVAPTPEAIFATQKLASKKHSERSSPSPAVRVAGQTLQHGSDQAALRQA
jgi:hypothetical protein